LIEGDATLAMTLYLTKHPMIALAFLRTAQETSAVQFKQAPRALQLSLLFPYTQGSQWAEQVYRRGGWEMVSNAFTKLPQSTEQILHAEKYFSYEAPVKLALPNFKRALGPKWKRIDSDVNGEWGYYLVLDEYLKSETQSRQAAAGWGGDRFAIYEGAKPSDVFLAQVSAWDTPEDAKEFYDAYEQRTLKRFPQISKADGGISSSGDQREEWRSRSGRGAMELRGSRVVIIEGAPAKANIDRLLRLIWQQG
jgi:hypothetical protein